MAWCTIVINGKVKWENVRWKWLFRKQGLPTKTQDESCSVLPALVKYKSPRLELASLEITEKPEFLK